MAQDGSMARDGRIVTADAAATVPEPGTRSAAMPDTRAGIDSRAPEPDGRSAEAGAPPRPNPRWFGAPERQGLGALQGFKKVPLVSLVEALKPLDELDLDVSIVMAKAFAHNLLLKEPDPYGLTADEIASIHLYTQESPLYISLNGSLRSEKRSACVPYFPFMRLFQTALGKLPVLASGGSIWRGIRYEMSPQDLVDGALITWWAYSSCSRKINVTSTFADAANVVLFCINTPHSARDISRYSAMQTEQEVLLPAGTMLRVEGTMRPGTGALVAHLSDLMTPVVPLSWPASVAETPTAGALSSPAFSSGPAPTPAGASAAPAAFQATPTAGGKAVFADPSQASAAPASDDLPSYDSLSPPLPPIVAAATVSASSLRTSAPPDVTIDTTPQVAPAAVTAPFTPTAAVVAAQGVAQSSGPAPSGTVPSPPAATGPGAPPATPTAVATPTTGASAPPAFAPGAPGAPAGPPGIPPGQMPPGQMPPGQGTPGMPPLAAQAKVVQSLTHYGSAAAGMVQRMRFDTDFVFCGTNLAASPGGIACIGDTLFLPSEDSLGVAMVSLTGVSKKRVKVHQSDTGFCPTSDIAAAGNHAAVLSIRDKKIHVLNEKGESLRNFRAGSSPVGVALGNGLVYVSCDTGSNRVMLLGDDGQFVGSFGPEGRERGELLRPRGITAAYGEVFVADSGAHRISVFRAADGIFLRSLGSPGNGEGQLNSPLHVCARGGLVFVADSGNSRVAVLAADTGQHVAHLGGPELTPNARAVCISDDGTLYVVCAHASCQLVSRRLFDPGVLPVAAEVSPWKNDKGCVIS